MSTATEAIQALMTEEFIVHADLIGENFEPLSAEVKALTGTEEGIRLILQQADAQTKAYADKHIGKKKKATAS